MKILLTSIGSRGDVQPLLALAVELQMLVHDAVICTAPNFRNWVESYGISFVPIGIDLEKWTKSGSGANKPQQKPTPEQLRELARYSVIGNFQGLAEAAKGCDLIVSAGVVQNAAQSTAAALNIPCVFVAYSPNVLPSPDHPPAKMDAAYPQSLSAEENQSLWSKEEAIYNDLFCDAINGQRSELGLLPINNVYRYITTDHPWLAADPVLGPAGTSIDQHITQTGAWFLSDTTPLPESLLRFLEDGEPPVYFGFGSMRGSEQTSRMLIEAARSLGRRAIILQGWGDLNVIDSGNDCMVIGDVSHERLLPHVAAVVHHGGAGTTAASARSGKPQVIVPHVYDQYYWAYRIETLGVGSSLTSASDITVDALADALHTCLKPEVSASALSLADRIVLDGGRTAAERLIESFG